MAYYIFIKNGEIQGRGQAHCLNDDILNIEVDKEIYENLEQYVWNGSEVIPDPEYDRKMLNEAKEEKYKEALEGAYEWQEKGYVEYKEGKFEFSAENRNNLRDTYEALLALGETSTLWNDKDDKIIELNLDDIQYIRLNLILSAIKKIWIEDYPKYLALIQEAKSLEEVGKIVINYGGDNETIRED